MNSIEKMVLFAHKAGLNHSKDPSTKIGAVITDGLNILTFGYNGLPRDIKEDVRERIDRNNTVGNRPVKYSWFEHGERNAIYNIARNASIFNSKVLLVDSDIDIEDLRCAVSAGLQSVILIADKNEQGELVLIKDEYSNRIAKEMIEEAKMKVYLLERTNDEETMIKNICMHKSLISETGMKANKLFKKIELLKIHKEIFAQYYELKGVDDKAFKKVKGSAVIFDKKDYNDLSISCTGLNEDMLNNISDQNVDLIDFGLGAIRNVVYSAIQPLLKNKSIFVNLCPCVDCAKAIASVGIKKAVYMLSADVEVQKRWSASFEKSDKYLSFFKVETHSVIDPSMKK